MLPSKYSPEGLSESDQHRVITISAARKPQAIEYTIKTIESKIHNALINQSYQNNNSDRDIEMVPMEDAEVDVISSYINYSRDSGNLHVSDEVGDNMIVEKEQEVINGNTSILVVDTNFILSHLKVIDELKELAIEYSLKIVIPNMVIRELDGLKNSSRIIQDSPDRISGVSVGHLARWANDWIYNSLASNSDVVIGQKLRQRLDKNVEQDDAILDCCLYFKKLGNLVVLLSNDKNLCTKALANDVLTVTFKSGMSAKLIAKVIYEENVNKFGKLHQVSSIFKQQQQQQVEEEESIMEPSREWVQSTQEVNHIQSFEQASIKVYNEIQMILLSAIHHCMEIEYEEELELLRDYNKESVVNMHDCSEILIRFWFTVFEQYFKLDPSKFVPFKETGKGRNSIKTSIYVDIPTSSSELHEFIMFWSKCLKIIYDSVMDETQQIALDALIKRWGKIANLEL